MSVKRIRPKVGVTLPPEQHQYLVAQAESRGVPVSQVVSEAIQLLEVGVVYQLDNRAVVVKAA